MRTETTADRSRHSSFPPTSYRSQAIGIINHHLRPIVVKVKDCIIVDAVPPDLPRGPSTAQLTSGVGCMISAEVRSV